MRTLILLLLISLPAFISLVRPGFFPMHDDMQVMRLLQMDKCIKDGQIPCRWVPDMGFGYGYPQFNYYAPLPYYVMEGVYLIGLGFLDSVKTGFVLSLIVGVVGMYLLGKSLFGKYAGLLSALFYTYLPYRAVNMYVRGAMGELWGMALLPFVFWSAYLLIKGEKKSLLLFTLSLSALLTSHNITSVMATPFLFLWFVALIIVYKNEFLPDWKNRILSILAGFLWAVGLSAFFVLPAWFERNLVHIESLTGGYFNYINHFVGIKQLLFSNYWGYGTSEIGPYDETLLSIGLWYWLIPFISLFLYFVLRKKKESVIIAYFFLVGWVSLFLIHPKSQFIWESIKLLSLFQFPWRFLALAGFAFSLSAGAIGVLIDKTGNFLLKAFIPLSLVLLLFYSSFFRPKEWLDISDSDKFSGQEWLRQQTVSIYDYLPIYAEKTPIISSSDAPAIIEGEAFILEGAKGSNWQRWKVLVTSSGAILQLPVYYFPNMIVEVDQRKENYDYSNEHGLLTLKIPNGEHVIYAKLTDTPIRTASNLLTLVSLVAIPIYTKKNKKP